MSSWKSPRSRLAFRPLTGQMPGYSHRPGQAAGDQRRDRVRLVVPAADRVIEVVVALQRHAAPAGLVVQYMITHDDPHASLTEPLIDTTEIAQEQLERALE
jgi:hypothetical protein